MTCNFVEFWSLLDPVVHLEQKVAYNHSEFPNVIVLKALSVCKGLQHVGLLHLPKIVVVTAFESIAQLRGLRKSCLFFALLFTIMGVNMFGLGGDMRRVCARMHMYSDAVLIKDTQSFNLDLPSLTINCGSPLHAPARFGMTHL